MLATPEENATSYWRCGSYAPPGGQDGVAGHGHGSFFFKPGKHFPRSSPSRLIFTDRSRENIRDTGLKNNDLDKTITPNLKVKEAKEKVEVTVPCTTSDCQPGGGAGIGKDGDVRWKRDIPVNCRLVSL